MKIKILSLAIVALLGGCASIPDFTENRQALIRNNQEIANYGLSQVSQVNRENWWLDFQDSQLNDLLSKVQNNNVDLKIAKLNLEKSQTYYQVIESNSYQH